MIPTITADSDFAFLSSQQPDTLVFPDLVNNVRQRLRHVSSSTLTSLTADDVVAGTCTELKVTDGTLNEESIFLLATGEVGKKSRVDMYNRFGKLIGVTHFIGEIRIDQPLSQGISGLAGNPLNYTVKSIKVADAAPHVQDVRNHHLSREGHLHQQSAHQKHLNKLMTDPSHAGFADVIWIFDYLSNVGAEKFPLFVIDSRTGLFGDAITWDNAVLQKYVHRVMQRTWLQIEDDLMKKGVTFGFQHDLFSSFSMYFRQGAFSNICMRDGTIIDQAVLEKFGEATHDSPPVVEKMGWRGVWSEQDKNVASLWKDIHIEKNNERMMHLLTQYHKRVADCQTTLDQASKEPNLDPHSPYNIARTDLMIALVQEALVDMVCKTGTWTQASIESVYQKFFRRESYANQNIKPRGSIFLETCCRPIYNTMHEVHYHSLLHPQLRRTESDGK